ncbi:hypothetical protein Tco_1552884 [Tanacetum coccineum]
MHRPSVSTASPSISTARPISAARPSINTARPVCTARPSINTARPVNTVRPVYATRPTYPRMDNVRPRGSCSPIKRIVVNTGKGKLNTDLKKSRWVWRPKGNYMDHVSKTSGSFMLKKGNPKILLQDHAVVDSGCSSHMTGNKAYLSDYEDFNGGFVAFGSDPKGGSRESLERDMDGTAEFLLSNFFDFWLTKVSNDMLKVSTNRQSLYRYKAVRENTGRGLECNFWRFLCHWDASTINTYLNYTIDPS